MRAITNASQINEMRARVIESFPFNNSVLGSKLGELLTPYISPYRKFSQVGGLKAFVSEYLSDILEWVARTNGTSGDDVYRFVDQRKPEWQAVESLPPTVFWVAFSNPRIGSRFAISPSKDAFFYCPAADCALPSEWHEVEKISEEDYRKMAVEYAGSLSDEYKFRALDLISQPAFNPSWVAFLQNEVGREALQKWEGARVQGVKNLLRKRLRDVGCLEAIQISVENLLADSRASGRPASGEPLLSPQASLGNIRAPQYGRRSPEKGTNPITPGVSCDDESFIRALVHSAVEKMAIEDLRSLRIPVGILLDAMRSR